MPPTFFETSAFKTPLSMRLSLPIEFIVSLCNLLRVKQCITITGPVFALKLTSREIPISRHVVVHVSVRRHFEGSHEGFLAFVSMLARSKVCHLNSICTKRSKYIMMKMVSAIHAYFASACICLAEVIPKVSDKCRRPTNAADTLVLEFLKILAILVLVSYKPVSYKKKRVLKVHPSAKLTAYAVLGTKIRTGQTWLGQQTPKLLFPSIIPSLRRNNNCLKLANFDERYDPLTSATDSAQLEDIIPDNEFVQHFSFSQ